MADERPAARLTDMHICPAATGPVPHVGGPISGPGCPTVLIGGLPAARVTDMATCVGPPDLIIKGSSTVLIGNLPAARMGDQTAHGGVIVLGMPTVLIGDAAGGTAASEPGGSGGIPAPAVAAASEPAGPGGIPAPAAAAGKTSPKGGSTVVTVDDVKQTILIRTNMEFSGPGASQKYAKAAKKQIEDTWNGSATRNGKPYTVKVEINAKYNSSGTATKGYDQITVDPKNKRMSQTLYGAGPGYQTPEAATDVGRPRRIAHEYGHTLGVK